MTELQVLKNQCHTGRIYRHKERIVSMIRLDESDPDRQRFMVWIPPDGLAVSVSVSRSTGHYMLWTMWRCSVFEMQDQHRRMFMASYAKQAAIIFGRRVRCGILRPQSTSRDF